MLIFADERPETAFQGVRKLPDVLQAEGQKFESAILRHGRFSNRPVIEARRPGNDPNRVLHAEGRHLNAPPGGTVLLTRLADHPAVGPGDSFEIEFLSGRREVSYILVSEMMLISVIAQPMGWFISRWIASLMTNAFTSDLYPIPLVLKPATYSTASLVVRGAALVSVLILQRRLDHLNPVSNMKPRA